MIRFLIMILMLSFLGLGKGRAQEKDPMEEPKGIIGRYYEDDLPVIMKFVNELPNDSIISKFPFLTVVSWKYDGSAKNGHSIPPSAGQSEPPAADQSEHSGADESEPLKRSILFECCDGFFCKKDHGEQTDRYAKGKKDLQIVRRGGQQATDQQGTWHLPQHGGQVHRVLQVLQADALRGLGDDPGGDPQALQGGPKAQERTAEDLRAVLPLF